VLFGRGGQEFIMSRAERRSALIMAERIPGDI